MSTTEKVQKAVEQGKLSIINASFLEGLPKSIQDKYLPDAIRLSPNKFAALISSLTSKGIPS